MSGIPPTADAQPPVGIEALVELEAGHLVEIVGEREIGVVREQDVLPARAGVDEEVQRQPDRYGLAVPVEHDVAREEHVQCSVRDRGAGFVQLATPAVIDLTEVVVARCLGGLRAERRAVGGIEAAVDGDRCGGGWRGQRQDRRDKCRESKPAGHGASGWSCRRRFYTQASEGARMDLAATATAWSPPDACRCRSTMRASWAPRSEEHTSEL